MSALPVDHVIFGSEEFSDQTIFTQLKSLEHQLRLADHGDWLNALGPCTVSLAEAMSSAKNKSDAFKQLKNYVSSQQNLDRNLGQLMCDQGEQVLQGLRIIAESYLSRTGRSLPSWGEGSEDSVVPDVTLKGASGRVYKPKQYLARGSAGLIYSAERDGKGGFVLKRVYPTQFESALNEYKIGSRLRGCKACLTYIDSVLNAEQKEIWLVLPLINRSEKYGVDLREYIVNGFFQEKAHEAQGRSIVIQLLEGLEQVAARGIIMRDVKPDNVLIQETGNGNFEAFWTDFGLAVDLGSQLDGSNLRKLNASSSSNVRDDLVCWWYATCKLVPRPKWHARRPPERGFANPKETGGAHSYDIYMAGIIVVCMAIGVDLPHIDQADCRKALEAVLGKSLDKSYLHTLELGESLTTDSATYAAAFRRSFGADFGETLFQQAKRMLSLNPADRPSPSLVLTCLQQNTGD